MRTAGFVLTGGLSSRMGRDKALLSYQGSTLVEWVGRQVQDSAGSAVLVGAPERYRSLPIPCISETYQGSGPMSGIEAALSSIHAREWNLIVACDMPGISAGLLRTLLAACRDGLDAVAAGNSERGPEPLCAVYHARLLPLVRRSLEENKLKVISFLRELNLAVVDAGDPVLLRNVNTAEDWANDERHRP